MLSLSGYYCLCLYNLVVYSFPNFLPCCQRDRSKRKSPQLGSENLQKNFLFTNLFQTKDMGILKLSIYNVTYWRKTLETKKLVQYRYASFFFFVFFTSVLRRVEMLFSALVSLF